METELENFRSKRFHFGEINLLDVGGMVLEGMIRRNPGVLLGLLGGGSSAETPDSEEGLGETPEVEDGSGESGLTEEDLEALDRINNEFTEEQSAQFMTLVQGVSQRPEIMPHLISIAYQIPQPSEPVSSQNQ